MKLDIDNFRHALDTIGDSGGLEAAIVAQFALDLAVTAQFRSDGGRLDSVNARRLLHLRIARHRAVQHQASGTIHSHVRQFQMQARESVACVQALLSCSSGQGRRRGRRNDG